MKKKYNSQNAQTALPKYIQSFLKLEEDLSVDICPKTDVSEKCCVEEGVFQSLETARMTATFAPLHYEPNYAYPLLVWLHTPGEDERQLLRIMPMLSLRNYVAVAVRGSVSFGRDGLPKSGFYWDSATYETTFSAVLEAITSVRQRYNIASNRIYLVGCGDGGTMAQRLALRNPSCFNGVVSLGGAVPEDMMLLENFRELRQVRFFYALARSSQAFSVESICDNLRVLYAAGVRLTLRNYPGVQPIQAEMLKDVNRWVMGDIESALL